MYGCFLHRTPCTHNRSGPAVWFLENHHHHGAPHKWKTPFWHISAARVSLKIIGTECAGPLPVWPGAAAGLSWKWGPGRGPSPGMPTSRCRPGSTAEPRWLRLSGRAALRAHGPGGGLLPVTLAGPPPDSRGQTPATRTWPWQTWWFVMVTSGRPQLSWFLLLRPPAIGEPDSVAATDSDWASDRILRPSYGGTKPRTTGARGSLAALASVLAQLPAAGQAWLPGPGPGPGSEMSRNADKKR